MPNWCNNNLYISGDEGEIERLVELVKHKRKIDEDVGCNVFDFQNIVPYDETYKEDGWYDWNIKNWGTKWNSNASQVIRPRYGQVEFSFDTAWSPPVPVFAKLKKMFPRLEMEIDWEEEGGLAGNIGFNKRGKVVLTDKLHSRDE